jgi:hypothetical protein
MNQFLEKLKICVPDEPTIRPLGIYPREMKANAQTKTCPQMLLVIVPNWDQVIISG